MKISCDTCRQHLGELLDNPEERGAAPSDLLVAAREHLAGCAECRHEFALLAAARDTLRDFPVLAAPSDLQSRIRQQLEAAPATAIPPQQASAQTVQASTPSQSEYLPREQVFPEEQKRPPVITAAATTAVKAPAKTENPPRDWRVLLTDFLKRPANVAWASCAMIVVAGFVSLSLPREDQFAPEPTVSQSSETPRRAEKDSKTAAATAPEADPKTAAKAPAAPAATPTPATKTAPAPGTPKPDPAAETAPAWTPLPDLPPELSALPSLPEDDQILPPPAPPRSQRPAPKPLPPPVQKPEPAAPKSAEPAPAASTPAPRPSTRPRNDKAADSSGASQLRRNRAMEDGEAASAFSARPERRTKATGPQGPQGPSGPMMYSAPATAAVQPITRTITTQFVSPRNLGWAQISVNLPEGVHFSDGTSARVIWRGTAPAREAIDLDFEVQVASGSHSVTLTLQEVKNGDAQTVARKTVTVSGNR